MALACELTVDRVWISGDEADSLFSRNGNVIELHITLEFKISCTLS
jgi:hypothetical protein